MTHYTAWRKRRPSFLLSHALKSEAFCGAGRWLLNVGELDWCRHSVNSDLICWKGLCYIDNMLVMGEGDDLGCPPKLGQNLE